MRFLTCLLVIIFSSHLSAAEFQLPDYVLGTAKAEIKTEVLDKTSITLFGADAQLETQWTEDKLAALHLTYYRGADYKVLREKASRLLQQLTTQFGAVIWVSSESATPSQQTIEQQVGLIDQVLEKAAETSAGYRQSHLASTRLVLDFQPSPQPDNLRVHLSLSYVSLKDEYVLELFFDQSTAPERTATSIVNLEAF